MNGKKRYIPIVALGALLLSLLAILPVAGAGSVEFIDPGDINNANDGSLSDNTPDEQEWSKQGGQAGILFEDDDLDRPVRRVLALATDTAGAGEGAEITAHSKVVKVPAAGELVADANPQRSGNQLLKAGDYVYFDADGNHTATDAADFRTLRKVVSVTRTDAGGSSTAQADREYDITLDAAFPDDSSDMVIRRVNDTVVNHRAFSNVSHLEIGLAEVVNIPGASTASIQLAAPILPSQIAATYSTAATPAATASRASDFGVRLGGNPDTRISERDVLAFKITSNAPGERLRLTDADDDEITPADPAIDPDGTGVGNPLLPPGAGEYFVMYWAAVVNNTGSSITIQSQAATSPQGYTLKESSDGSGRFAAKIDLIPSRVSVPWTDFDNPFTRSGAGTETDPYVWNRRTAVGSTVTLTATRAGKDNLKVQYPGGWELRERQPDGTRPPASRPEGNVTVRTVPDFTTDIPRLPVNEADTVTVNHPDGSEDLRVETTAPTFANFSPTGEDAIGSNSRPRVQADVSDGGSGLKETGLGIVFALKTPGASRAEFAYNNPADSETPNVMKAPDFADTDAISGGFEVSGRLLSEDDLTGDGEIWVWIKATDIAGNTAYSDSEPTTSAGDDICEATSEADLLADANGDAPKCDPYVIMVDSTDPKMQHAETGRWWDTSLNTGDSEDKTEYRTSKANKSSILVIFDEPLNAGSVQAADFEVNDARPSSADVYEVKVRDDDVADGGDGVQTLYEGTKPQFVGLTRGYVFLTLASELTPNARPRVAMIGEVRDKAGNEQTDDQRDPDAVDRIGPSLTVSFSEGNRPVTNKDVTITIASDENVGTPTVSFYRIESYSPSGGDSVQARGRKVSASAQSVSAREYTAKLTAPSDGLYTVHVEATDGGTNKGEIGEIGVVGMVNGDSKLNGGDVLSTAIDVDDDTDAILFERDKSIAGPDLDPADGVQTKFETDAAGGYLEIDYSAEAREYTSRSVPIRSAADAVVAQPTATPPIEAKAAVTMRAAMSGDDLDTYGRIDVLTATLDGEDISGDLIEETDGNVFLYPLSGLEEDREYKLEITVRDAAGNTNPAPHKGTVKVIKRKPYKLELRPGWNLVSLPGQPADTDVNAVIPADHPIDAIRTYDRASGGWIFAEDDGEGRFIGPLVDEDIGFTADNAYMLRTDSTLALEVDIPKIPAGAAVFLPTINLEQGWNLVPIVDPDGDFKLDEQTAEDNYFSGLSDGSIAEIYTHDLKTNRWKAVKEHEVQIGKGYWVYANKPGVIVP